MATITLHLPEKIERKLQARAQERGQDLGTAALQILEQELDQSAPPNPNDLPYEVWRQRFEAMLQNLPHIDVLVDDSRETIYEGRGE